ncbi:MAG: AI-2E family transporter [Bacteroidales bacterium]|nr:AI-2E family transporter [Bacteroidales bacterium]
MGTKPKGKHMNNTERYTDKLAKYILAAAGIGIIGLICWYFSDILIYILLAVVVSLIAQPVMTLLRKISIKGHKAPDWLLAMITIATLILIFFAVITMIVPIVSGIIKGISLDSIETAARHISGPLSELNTHLRESFPKLGDDFRIEFAAIQELQKMFDPSVFSSVIGSAASFVTDFGIGIFSVVFISFFFIKDDGQFTTIVRALVPDKHEAESAKAIGDISYLLSRYFIGVMIEVLGVALLNFLGLLLIARLGFNAALGIAFLTGILNVMPYVGPLIGGVMGTVLGLVIKYSSAVPVGLDVSFTAFTLILIAIFSFTQLIDNILYQPVIYSTSIKAKPLEIFIVLLIAGHLAGPLGMIVAIPCYTAVRVVAFRFFRQYKPIRRLIPSEKLITD